MLGKKFGSMKKLTKKAKQSQHEQLENLLVKDQDDQDQVSTPTSAKSLKKQGTFVVYVGEERERFAVPTGYLSHPLFKILLEKTYNEFGFQQTNGLVVPCSVTAFQEVVNAVECCNGKFDFGDLVEEFL